MRGADSEYSRNDCLTSWFLPLRRFIFTATIDSKRRQISRDTSTSLQPRAPPSMASAVPLDSSIPPPGSRPLTGSKHVLSVDKDGHGHLVTPPSSREDLSEASSIELKQAESSNAPTSTSTGSNSELLTENELIAIAGNEVS